MAQANLGLMYLRGAGAPKNQKMAVKCFEKAAMQGNANAQYSLGVMYFHGASVPENLQTAAKWFRKSAKQGYAAAQFDLGRMYFSGHGVKQDNGLKKRRIKELMVLKLIWGLFLLAKRKIIPWVWFMLRNLHVVAW